MKEQENLGVDFKTKRNRIRKVAMIVAVLIPIMFLLFVSGVNQRSSSSVDSQEDLAKSESGESTVSSEEFSKENLYTDGKGCFKLTLDEFIDSYNAQKDSNFFIELKRSDFQTRETNDQGIFVSTENFFPNVSFSKGVYNSVMGLQISLDTNTKKIKEIQYIVKPSYLHSETGVTLRWGDFIFASVGSEFSNLATQIYENDGAPMRWSEYNLSAKYVEQTGNDGVTLGYFVLGVGNN